MINSLYLSENLIAIVTDLYLFLFFLILYNIIENRAELKRFVLLWLTFATLQGILMFRDIFLDFASRARGTFLNPNMGASYLGMSFFLLFLPNVKMGWKKKAFLAFVILSGLLATKSLSGIAVFFISVLALVFRYLLHTRILIKLKLGIVVLLALVVGLIMFPEIKEIPNLLDRSPRSTFGRTHLWRAGLEHFVKSPFGIGTGPAAFAKAGPAVPKKLRGKENEPVSIRRELHSDWLAFLAERGIIAFLGLVLFFFTLKRMISVSMRRADSERDFVWILGLAGMYIFILISSFFHELLHFRHVWCGFAVIAVDFKLREKKES